MVSTFTFSGLGFWEFAKIGIELDNALEEAEFFIAVVVFEELAEYLGKGCWLSES